MGLSFNSSNLSEAVSIPFSLHVQPVKVYHSRSYFGRFGRILLFAVFNSGSSRWRTPFLATSLVFYAACCRPLGYPVSKLNCICRMGDVSVYGIYGYVAEKLEMDVAVQLLNQFGALIWIFIFRNIRAILPSGVKYGLRLGQRPLLLFVSPKL